LEPGPPSADRDARLLGLALLHGYVEAEQLQRAAESDSSPSRILAELRRSGALDDPCLEGLGQALRAFQAGPEADARTGPTHLEPPRHFSDTAEGRPAVPDAWDDDAGRWNSGARVLRRFKVERWKHYRNLRFIGEGGMGRIYKAEDPDLKRTVALKFLRGQEPGQLKRFLFEAQAQALMDHANICRVYEISEWQGQHYIAMQYVNGPTLLRAAPGLSLEAKLRIAVTVAEAVHAAHRRGLIHRDLKPANVLLEQDGAGGFKPYVLDFGLARELDAPGLTASGLVLGTTAYISPEQARGEAHHVDRRTDIYGLGATLFELFTGTPPFGEAQGLDCLRRVVEEEPPRLRSLAPQLPRDLETVVMKCLEKEPARRYDDAQGLAEDLRRVQDGEPIQARRLTLAHRLSRFAKRNRALVAVSSLAAAGFLLLGGVAGYAKYAAAVRERHAQHFSQEAERIESLLRYVRLLPSQNVEPFLDSARLRLAKLEKEAASAGRHAAGPGAYATGRALLAFGEFDRALPFLQKAEQEDFRSAGLFNALGRCYGFVYQRELERARRLEHPDLQAARKKEVAGKWKELAQDCLRKATGSSLEPAEFLEALLDSYESRFDSALEKARRTVSSTPWLYEARGLEGEFLLAKAREASDPGTVKTLLGQASEAFRQARGIAPSDAGLWLGEARVQREFVQQFALSDEPAPHLLGCRAAVDQCLRIRPSDPSPLLQVAWALLGTANRRNLQGKEAGPVYREGILLAERVLQARRDDPEANAARVQLLEGLGRWQRSTGEDPTATLNLAVEAARSSLDANPGDPILLSSGSTAAQQLMTHLATIGRPHQAAFEVSLRWADDLRRRFPDLGYSHFRIAAIHVELADILLWHGGDPRADLAKVRVALDAGRQARTNPIRQEKFLKNIGNLHLIHGQFLFLRGEDCTQELDRAIEGFAAVLALPTATGADHGGLAEACLYRAMGAMAAGSEPFPWIERAERALERGRTMDQYYWLQQLKGQSAWIQARWAQSRGGSGEALYQASLRWLKQAAAEGKTAVTMEWIARVHFDRARSRHGRADDIAEGLRAARAALRMNPASAEATLLSGQLLLLQAQRGGQGPMQREGLALLDRALGMNPSLRHRLDAERLP